MKVGDRVIWKSPLHIDERKWDTEVVVEGLVKDGNGDVIVVFSKVNFPTIGMMPLKEFKANIIASIDEVE